MHIIQKVQEQHAIYFGYAVFRRLGSFYRNRKGFLTDLKTPILLKVVLFGKLGGSVGLSIT